MKRVKLTPPPPGVKLTPSKMERIDPETVRAALGAEEFTPPSPGVRAAEEFLRLVNCTACEDVYRPTVTEKACMCGRTRARELAGNKLGVGGPCRVIAIPFKDYDRARIGDRGLWIILGESDDIVRGGL